MTSSITAKEQLKLEVGFDFFESFTPFTPERVISLEYNRHPPYPGIVVIGNEGKKIVNASCKNYNNHSTYDKQG